jgi:hypothetical protein
VVSGQQGGLCGSSDAAWPIGHECQFAGDGIYLDEEGNVFQLLDKGETKPIEVEHFPGTEKTELEVLLEASMEGRKTNEQNGGSKRVQRKNRNNGRKQGALEVDGSAPESLSSTETASAEPSADTTNGAASDAPVQLNLRQKLAEVRRRIGYVQKRGHNERNNYSYVTAADIAGSVGDILAELGVVVIPDSKISPTSRQWAGEKPSGWPGW